MLSSTVLRLGITRVFKSRPFDDGVALSPARAAGLQDIDFPMISQEGLERSYTRSQDRPNLRVVREPALGGGAGGDNCEPK